MKDTNKQPEEEIQRARFERVPKHRRSVPVELRGANLPAHRCVHQPGSYLHTTLWDSHGTFLT